jgi:hypothetical protein
MPKHPTTPKLPSRTPLKVPTYGNYGIVLYLVSSLAFLA